MTMDASFANNNHRMSGMLEFLYRVVKPFRCMATHEEVEMLRVMHAVYTQYYHKRHVTMADMAGDETTSAPRDYVPPETAPAAICALFEDPEAHISCAAMEAAMEACVQFVSARFERRISPMVHHVYRRRVTTADPATPRRTTAA